MILYQFKKHIRNEVLLPKNNKLEYLNVVNKEKIERSDKT